MRERAQEIIALKIYGKDRQISARKNKIMVENDKPNGRPGKN